MDGMAGLVVRAAAKSAAVNSTPVTHEPRPTNASNTTTKTRAVRD